MSDPITGKCLIAHSFFFFKGEGLSLKNKSLKGKHCCFVHCSPPREHQICQNIKFVRVHGSLIEASDS